MVRWLRLADHDDTVPQREEERLHDELRGAMAEVLDDPDLRHPNGTPFSPRLLEKMKAKMTWMADSADSDVAEEMTELRLMLLQTMRERLITVGAAGKCRTPTLRHALATLDAEQLSIQVRRSDA